MTNKNKNQTMSKAIYLNTIRIEHVLMNRILDSFKFRYSGFENRNDIMKEMKRTDSFTSS